MNVKYIEENRTYVITSHMVARNNMFFKVYYCQRFISQFYKYLSPLCELVSYSFSAYEFTMVIKTFDRNSFVDYYKLKQIRKGKEIGLVPESTYIFSQAVANLLASMAIHFNRKEGRTGAMFARRFRKVLISSKGELEKWIRRIHNKQETHRYGKRWQWKVKRRRQKGSGKPWFWNSVGIFGKQGASGRMELKKWLEKMSELQGQSKLLSFFEIYLSKTQQYLTFTPP